MIKHQHDALMECALSEIDQLLNNFDMGGQIESVLPQLLRHRCTLVRLRNMSKHKVEPASGCDDDRWADDLVSVYKRLGGMAPHSAVYRKMGELRQSAGRSWPPKAHEAIRQTLQAHNAESPQYRGGVDLFRMVRPGLWRLKDFDRH